MNPQPAMAEGIPDFFRKPQAQPLGAGRIVQPAHLLGISFGLAAGHQPPHQTHINQQPLAAETSHTLPLTETPIVNINFQKQLWLPRNQEPMSF